MKKLIFLSLLSLLFLQSCEKKVLSEPEPVDFPGELPPRKTEVFISGVKLNDGILQFEGPGQFMTALESNSGAEMAALDKWEEEIGFTSLRKLFNEADEEYENYVLSGKAGEFREKWKGVASVEEDGDVIPYVDGSVIMFLNRDGMFMIGDMLYKVMPGKVASIFHVDPESVPEFLEVSEIEDKYVVEVHPILVNGLQASQVSFRDDIRTCIHKSNENNNGSYSLETELKLVETKIAAGTPNSYIRIGDVRYQAVSKRKRTFGWFKDGAVLTINGSVFIGDIFGTNGSFTISEGPTFTREISRWVTQAAIGSNDNKQKFVDPTNVIFTSDKVPGEPCILTD